MIPDQCGSGGLVPLDPISASGPDPPPGDAPNPPDNSNSSLVPPRVNKHWQVSFSPLLSASDARKRGLPPFRRLILLLQDFLITAHCQDVSVTQLSSLYFYIPYSFVFPAFMMKGDRLVHQLVCCNHCNQQSHWPFCGHSLDFNKTILSILSYLVPPQNLGARAQLMLPQIHKISTLSPEQLIKKKS